MPTLVFPTRTNRTSRKNNTSARTLPSCVPRVACLAGSQLGAGSRAAGNRRLAARAARHALPCLVWHWAQQFKVGVNRAGRDSCHSPRTDKKNMSKHLDTAHRPSPQLPTANCCCRWLVSVVCCLLAADLAYKAGNAALNRAEAIASY